MDKVDNRRTYFDDKTKEKFGDGIGCIKKGFGGKEKLLKEQHPIPKSINDVLG